ncbi:MAG: hypothetical protein KGZ34_07155 [Nitrosarchaeum sp.]|nr:hypothetical protein [Nitrosarchaeum sp.]
MIYLKKIALDFDSVLSDTMRSWTCKHNQLYGTEFSKENIISWKFWDDLKVKVEIKDQCFQEAWKDWKNLPTTEPNLDKKVTKLSEFGTVEILTSIEPNYTKNVESWINEKDIFVKVVSSFKKNKIDDFNYDLYIDDDPDLAKKACSKNKKCFIYNQKWNHGIETCEYVSRIYSLTDAIDNIARKGL